MTRPPVNASQLWLRYAATGAVIGAIIGGLAGLVIGLIVYPPTAWFAVFEVGVPVAIVGGGAGLISCAA